MLIPVMDNLDKRSQSSSPASHLSGKIWQAWLIISCLTLTGLLIYPIRGLGPVVVGASLWFATISLFFARDPSEGVRRLFVSITSVLYGCLPWLSLWYLFQIGERSHEYMIFIIAVVMGSDTGGFIGGKLLGKHALAPRISPNKTWEGAGCAMLFATVIAGTYASVAGLLPPAWAMALSIIGSVAAMTGDLVESILKRYATVKDSGVLFPGHGGFLDRADGFIVATPILWLMIESIVR